MTVALRLAATLLDGVLLLALALTLELARTRLAARITTGPLPPLTQPLRDLSKLMCKRRVRPAFASPLHDTWPLAACAATGLAALIVPGFADGSITASYAQLPLLIGLIALGRAARVLAALDAGEGLQGRGAARAARTGLWSDTVWLVALAALAIGAHHASIPALQTSPALVMMLAVVAVVLVPVVGEAVPGDYAGPERALFFAEAMLRRAVLLALLVDIAVPYGIADATQILTWPLGLVAFVVKFGLGALILAVGGAMVPRVSPRISGGVALAALVWALARDIPVTSVAIGTGLCVMVAGLVRLWQRQPSLEAAALVQAGIALAGFGLGVPRGGWVILIGIALARGAAALAGRNAIGFLCLAALAGLPPFGLFTGDFIVIRAAFPVSPLLGAALLAGMVLVAILLLGRPSPSVIRPGSRMAAPLVSGALLVLLVLLGIAPVLNLIADFAS